MSTHTISKGKKPKKKASVSHWIITTCLLSGIGLLTVGAVGTVLEGGLVSTLTLAVAGLTGVFGLLSVPAFYFDSNFVGERNDEWIPNPWAYIALSFVVTPAGAAAVYLRKRSGVNLTRNEKYAFENKIKSDTHARRTLEGTTTDIKHPTK
ncbi:MAG: hypothetical protein SXQ77_04110 [Halobacteria archaeon]|nr:hypothetical protein [Halobacteria archaeon]